MATQNASNDWLAAGFRPRQAGPMTSPPLSTWLAESWSHEASVGEVEVDGATVRYRGWGLDDTGKPGLVLVHGFLAHARWWDHIGPRLADRYRVIAPDFTGMGDSDRRPVYSRRQYADELIAAARHAGVGRAAFVAHSFGAVSSLYAAKMAPDLVERVIVIDAHVFRSESEGTVAVQLEKFYPSFDAALSRYRLLPPGAWPDAEIEAYIARHSIRETAQGWGWKFDPETFRSAHREKLREELRGLPLPVDFVHAGNSEVVGDAELAAFLANMPCCGAPVTVPLSHHHIMIEQPVGLVAALNGLLARPHAAGEPP
jgi:pimeloyl-ACP methyl ester carboxylesterase